MRPRNTPWLVVGAVLVVTASTAAHHGRLDYRDDQIETVKGTLVKIDVSNPHSIVYLDNRDPQGAPGQWTIEWVAGLQLKRQGVMDGMLKPGDQLVITGYPSRNPAEHRLKLRTVARPADGWRWAGTFR
ncbi:MAG: hypothetical protein GEU82_16270 [Luteitalea sp.]|nr:hypothetical protein [Luteitalea sp.]